MPLRVANRPGTPGLWIVGTVRPAGATKGTRVRVAAGTSDPRLAAEAARALESRMLRDAWHGPRPAETVRTFLEAVTSYLDHAPRGPGTQALLLRLVDHFGAVPLASITQEAVDRARAAILRPGAKPSTVRRNLVAPLRAVLTHAHRRQWCPAPTLDAPPEPPGRTAFLTPAQARALEDAAAPHLAPLIRFLLCTGCRLGEALALEWESVHLADARVILHADATKAGRRRVVHLPPAAVRVLAALPGRTGPVWRTRTGAPYRQGGDYGGQIKKAWRTAAIRAGVPWATPHHTRHTWATWHYALYRDLLGLAAAGGWSTVALVERYAHIMPSGHEAAITEVWGTPLTHGPKIRT